MELREKVREAAIKLINERGAIESNDISECLGIKVSSAASFLRLNYLEWGLGRVGVGVCKTDFKKAYYNAKNNDSLYRAKLENAIFDIRKKRRKAYREKLEAHSKKLREKRASFQKNVVKKPVVYGDETLGPILDKSTRDWLRKIHEDSGKPLSALEIKQYYHKTIGKKDKSGDKWFEIIEELRIGIREEEYVFKNGCTSLASKPI